MKMFSLCLLFVSSVYLSQAQPTYIEIGSGGGITGSVTSYKLLPDGIILKGKGLGNIKYTECSKLKRSVAKELFRKSKNMQALRTEFSHPGNLYYFVTVSDNEQKNRVTWGDTAYPVPEEVKSFYQDIMERINALSFKPIP